VSIATYAQLQAAIARQVRQSSLTAEIPDYIALGEARMARDLRLQRMIATGTLATVAGTATVALPANWLEFQHIKIAGRAGVVDPSTVAGIEADYASTETGAPRKYAIRGNLVLLGPTPDAIYSLPASWYERIPALSDSNTSTWLLVDHPGIYLWAALIELSDAIPGDERVQRWEARYARELAEIQVADERARYAQVTQVRR
jgi:hypothetical protein